MAEDSQPPEDQRRRAELSKGGDRRPADAPEYKAAVLSGLWAGRDIYWVSRDARRS